MPESNVEAVAVLERSKRRLPQLALTPPTSTPTSIGQNHVHSPGQCWRIFAVDIVLTSTPVLCGRRLVGKCQTILRKARHSLVLIFHLLASSLDYSAAR